MAAKFLELFFLIIGTAGISTVYSLQEFFNTNKRPFSIWPNLENVHIFGPGVPSVPNSFHNRKSMIYHPEIFRPRARDDDLKRFDSLSLLRDSDAARWRDSNLNFDFLSRFRDLDAARWRYRDLNFDDYLSRFRDSDVARWRDDDQKRSTFLIRFKDSDASRKSIIHHPQSYDDLKILTTSKKINAAIDPYESSEESIRETDDINEEQDTSNDQKLPVYTQESSSSSPATPIESYAYSEPGTSSMSSDGVHFESDLPATHRKLRDSRVTEGISNTKFPLIIRITPTEWRKKSFSDINNDNVGLTDSKNTFTTFENSSERVITKLSTNNEDRKNASEFLTNISTKNEVIDDSFIGKYEDRTDGLTFPNSDSTTSDPTIPGTKSETRCTLCDFISFMKSKKEVLRTESKLILDISSTTKKEATDVSNETNFSNDTEITRQQNSKIAPNVESASTVFHPLSLMKATSLNDLVRYSDGIEHASKKELKLEPTVTESSLLNSQEIHSISTTKNIQTNSDISFSSFAVTFDDTIPQSKLSFPFETRSTIENLENKPTAESFLSSVKVTVSSFMDKETKGTGKEIFSKVSPSLEIHFAREVIKEDHIIEISSIRTARIVVTTVFLVIALTALTLLAVYLFRLRRREVQYDQLMLIS